jgi:hypothetical protein
MRCLNERLLFKLILINEKIKIKKAHPNRTGFLQNYIISNSEIILFIAEKTFFLVFDDRVGSRETGYRNAIW